MKNWISNLPYKINDLWKASTDHTSLITELMNFITDAGLTPSISNNNQLKEATQAYIAGAGTVYDDGYIKPGTLIPRNAADADHDITISTGKARDSSNTVNMDLLSEFTKQIDANWVAGNNVGGMASACPLIKNSNINQFKYASKNFSVAAQDTTPSDVSFKDDGTKMYVLGDTGNTIDAYDLGTPWDVNTSVYNGETIPTAPATLTYGFYLGNSGTKLYILDGNTDIIHQFTMSVAWDISTATTDSKTLTVTTQESQPWGIEFKPDGTKVYVIGLVADTVFAYDLGTPWDISTSTYNSENFYVGNQMTTPKMIRFNSDGFVMYVAGDTTDKIFEYRLATAYDLNTAEYSSRFLSISSEDLTILGLFIGNSDNNLYIAGNTSDTIYQYEFNYLKNANFHHFIIAKSDGTIDSGFDSDVLASNLLNDATEYLYYRRVFSLYTNENENIREFTAYGSGGNSLYTRYKVDQTLLLGTIILTPDYKNIGVLVPSGVSLDAHISGSCFSGTGVTVAFLSKDDDDKVLVVGPPNGDIYTTQNVMNKYCKTIDGQLKWADSFKSSSIAMNVYTIGYNDKRS